MMVQVLLPPLLFFSIFSYFIFDSLNEKNVEWKND